MTKKLLLIFCAVLISISLSSIVYGQSAEELAKKLSNPVASMISVPFQNNLDVRIGKFNGYRYILNVQPVIPITLSKSLNLINRIIIPVVSQYDITAKGAFQSGISDAVVSTFISPSQSKVIWGFGPVFLIPIASNDFLGTKKFGIGPTGVMLFQTENSTILIGILIFLF